MCLAEWVNRDQYFKKYGGLASDPFDKTENSLPKDINSTNDSANIVLKTVPLENLELIQVEEFWTAPDEFQNI